MHIASPHLSCWLVVSSSLALPRNDSSSVLCTGTQRCINAFQTQTALQKLQAPVEEVHVRAVHITIS